MGIPSSFVLNRLRLNILFISARIFITVFGFGAILWGALTIPIFWRQAKLEDVAQDIIRGETFKPEFLTTQMSAVETAENANICDPIAVRSAAIIRLRIAEDAERRHQKESTLASQRATLSQSIRRSLFCSPAEPFLWLILYWLERKISGSEHDEYSKYLEMSYRLGPNEGWIALMRSPIAFGNFQRLPPNLAEDAINEFVNLLRSKLIEHAVNIFIGPAWAEHNLIVRHLASIPVNDRRLFVNALRSRGYDVSVPGIANQESRPWSRP